MHLLLPLGLVCRVALRFCLHAVVLFLAKKQSEGMEKEEAEKEKLLAKVFSLKEAHVLNCMFQNWYPKWKRYTFPSRIIPLPEEFIQYLLADGVILPEYAFPPVKRDMGDDYTEDNDWYSLNRDNKLKNESDGSSDSEEEGAEARPSCGRLK